MADSAEILRQKREAAKKALEYVESGMTLGLGTGSTAREFVDLLGGEIKSGELRDIVGVPTSVATEEQARALGIPLKKIDEVLSLDLAVDGADEVDPSLNLIKGLGKALLREKFVEVHAKKLVIIVDDSKMVDRLGTKGPLPVEVVKFGVEATVRWIGAFGCRAEWWISDGKPAETDNGNYLVKCFFDGGILDAHALARALESRPGIVEHGLFLDMATTVIVAGKDGARVLARE